jgi:uncharacterized protein (DUF2225 family)
MSSNNLGGHDRDFFSRAAGDQPFMVQATSCPVCLYSGSTDDFDPATN